MKSMGWMTLVATLAVVGCGGGSDPSLSCGAGTVEENGACVVADANGADTGDGGADSNSGEAAIADATDAADSGPGDTGLPFGAKTFIDCATTPPDARCSAASPCSATPVMFAEVDLPIVWKLPRKPTLRAQCNCSCFSPPAGCDLVSGVAQAFTIGVRTAQPNTKLLVKVDAPWAFDGVVLPDAPKCLEKPGSLSQQCTVMGSSSNNAYVEVYANRDATEDVYAQIRKAGGSDVCP